LVRIPHGFRQAQPDVLNLTMFLKELVIVTYAVSVLILGKVFTPKALHKRPQRRPNADTITKRHNHVPVV
jgi:hypothetical protein